MAVRKYEVFITDTPDDDGDYRVEIQHPDGTESIEYSNDLGSILPTTEDFTRGVGS